MPMPIYNPIAAIERIAADISDCFPSAAVGLLTAASAIEVLLDQRRKDEADHKRLTDHWAEHD
jgi:hypothetical protein